MSKAKGKMMDTTEQYIKMAIGAFEDIGYIPADELPNLMIISSLWVEGPKIGEFALEVTWAGKFEDIRGGSTMPNPLGQLYRQDKLQGMLIPPFGNWQHVLSFFFDFCIDAENPLHEPYTSMEQLWLAFAMKEKYSKRWEDGKWVE